MTTKHTPGPWKTDGKVIFESPGNVVAKSVNKDMPDGTKTGVDFPIDLANARLIASAPELLEALLTLEETITALLESGRIDTQNEAPVIHGDVERAQAAIAKATGE